MAHPAPPSKDFYQLRIYHLKNEGQLAQTEAYLKNALVPALHRAGNHHIGVFRPLANDTSLLKSLYVLIPFTSEKGVLTLDQQLRKDAVYMEASRPFREAAADAPPYDRMETVVLEAFNGQKHLVVPVKKAGRIYELRSYESPTEKLHDKKVAMFENEEIALFRKLGFNVSFYGRVISGSHMPNFMYMPCFDSREDMQAHWKTFGADPGWKAMSSDPKNENKVSVSHIDSTPMTAADYSDF
jgi:hypothetical protein